MSEQEPRQQAEDAGREAAQGVPGPTDTGTSKTPEELRREIERTREELGDTVEALSQKADVKAQLSEKLNEQKAMLRERQHQLKAKASGARDRVSGATPDDAKRAASQVAQTAQERPVPIGVAVAIGLFVGWALGRR